MKKVLFITIFFFGLTTLHAQQWVEFSQQDKYKLFLNPALSGSESLLQATIAHRSQYTFLSKRALASQFAEFSMPIFAKNYGIGFRLVNDFIAYQRYTLAELTGAYHLSINKSTISFGIGVGISNLSINGNKLRAAGGNYENQLVIHNDEIIPAENSGGIAPSFSFGVHYKIASFKLGIAVQNINNPKFKLLKSNLETNISIDRTINAYTSYVIELKNVNIEPMASFNTDFIKHQIQFGILTEINNIYFGLSFRGYTGLNNDALIGTFGLKIKDMIRLGYSYDYNVSFLNKSNFGSHEISISYFLPQKFSTKNKGNVLFNPRYL